ncbi:MAG: MFS transporter [Dehalococcoidia bacterium]
MAERSRPFFYGWWIVIASFVIMVLTLGLWQSFGVFFGPILEEFGWPRDVAALGPSLGAIGLGVFAVPVGLATDRYGPRLVALGGGLLVGIGLLAMSQMTGLWQFYTIFSLAVGLGMSATYIPVVSAVNHWFVEKLGLAQGIVVSGVGLGTAVLPLVSRYLIGSFGWRTAYVFLGLLVGTVVSLSALVLRRDPQDKGLTAYGAASGPGEGGPASTGGLGPAPGGFTLRRALGNFSFWVVFIGGAFGFMSLDMVIVHLPKHATDIGLSAATGAGFISIIGVTAIIGKIGVGALSDRIGRRVALASSFGLGAVAMFWLVGARTAGAIYLFAALFGLAYGGWTPLFPAVTVELFGLSAMGAIYGMVHMGGSWGGAVGPVLAGWVFEATKRQQGTGSYDPAFIAGGLSLLAASGLSLLLPKHRRGDA